MEIVNLNHVAPEGTSVDFKKELTLDKLFKYMKQGQIVKVKVDQVRQVINEGEEPTYVWKVDFDGINGIVKFEDSGLEYNNQMQQFVGQEIFVQIRKVKRNPAYVIADRTSAVQILKKQLFEQLNEGKVIDGIIKGIGKNMVYVDIGGGYIVGLERKEATLSSSRKSLRQLFNIGQKLRVKVLSINKIKQKVRISHVATLKNPWKLYKFSFKDVVTAEIISITPNNIIFAEVEPGLDAIVILPSFPIQLNVGDSIQGIVIKFNPNEKKLRIAFKDKINK